MEKRFVLFIIGILLLLGSVGSNALANPKTEEVTDEQLLTYKKVVQEIEALRETLRASYKQAILEEKDALSIKRFWALKQAGEDTEKRAKLHLTKKELAAFEKITVAHKQLAETFKNSYTICVSEQLGISFYNTIAAKLATTPPLRNRYDALVVPKPLENQNVAPQPAS